MNHFKENVVALWNGLPSGVRRTVHTFWQVAGGVLLSGLLAAHSAQDVQNAVIVAGAAGLAAVKAVLLNLRANR